MVTYKPRCDDEARSNEQIDNFSQVMAPPKWDGEEQVKDRCK
jgi:hypothetical protein